MSIKKPNIYTIDTETNSLFFKHFFDLRLEGRDFLSSDQLSKIIEAFDPVAMVQMGIGTDTDDIIRHIHLLNPTSTIPPFKDNSGRKLSPRITRRNVEDYLTTGKNRISKARASQFAREHTKNQVASIILDNQLGWWDEFPYKKYVEEPKTKDVRKLLDSSIKAVNRRLEFKEQTYSKFINSKAGKGFDSIYSIMSEILSSGTIDNPVVLQAWNPSFDIPLIVSALHKGGHTGLLNDFRAKYLSGALKINAMENDWLKLAYGLSLENKDIFKNNVIRRTPEALKALGKVGVAPTSLAEFMYSSTPWNLDFVGRNIFGVTGTEQLHLAGADIPLAQDVQARTNEVFNEALAMARNLGHKVKSVDDLFKLDLRGEKLFSNALDKMLQERSGGRLTGEKAINLIGRSIDNFYKGNKTAFIASSGGGGGGGLGSIVPPSAGGWSGRFSGISKYSTLIASIALVTGMTYFGIDNENKAGLKQKFNNDIRIDDDGSIKIGAIDRSNEQYGPFVPSHPARKIVFPLLASAAFAYGIGYDAAKRRSLLGVKYKKPEGFGEIMRSAGRTIRYGVMNIEETVPLTRVFGVSSLMNSIAGTRTYGANLSYKMSNIPGAIDIDSMYTKEIVDGREVRKLITTDNKALRMYTFDVIKDNKVVGPNRSKLGNLDTFLDAIKETNPSLYDEIYDQLRPGAADSTWKRVAKIGTVGKGVNRKTVLWIDSLSETVVTGGERTLISKAWELDVITNIAMIRRRSFDRSENMTDMIAHSTARDAEMFSGRHSKISYNAYKDSLIQPAWVKRYPWAGPLYDTFVKMKYYGEIEAKGVGQGTDRLYRTVAMSLQNKKATINVQGFSGGKFLTPASLKRTGSVLNRIAMEYTISHAEKFFEGPFELMGLDANKIERYATELSRSRSLPKSLAGKALRFINKPHLGVGTTGLKYGIPEYMLRLGVKRILPAYVGLQLFDFTDKALGSIFTGNKETPGLVRGAAVWGYQQAMLAYSKISDMTGLTAWNKWQEKIAPGSTSVGLFAGGFSGAATVGFLSYLNKRGPLEARRYVQSALDLKATGGTQAQKIIRNVLSKSTLVKGALLKEGFIEGSSLAKTPTQKLFGMMIKNPKAAIFALASIPAIPFLPGFIGSSKSYAERKAEFEGRKEVAIRKSRGWMLSTSPYFGDKPIQYRHHASWLMSRDWEASGGVIWPNAKSKFLHQLTFGLLKPHVLEEYHSKSQPVYMSSSAAENVPAYGPIISALSNLIFGKKQYHNPEVVQNTSAKGILGGDQNIVGEADIKAAMEKINAEMLGLKASQGSRQYAELGRLSTKFFEQATEIAGFRGFMMRTIAQGLSGKKSFDEFTPRYDTSSKLYNPAYKLWGYSAGDITGIGGEFLRRIYQNPSHEGWVVNNLPNEFTDVSWIPEDKDFKDFTHGTTFDKIPMGWMYATRKGWEYLYPEVRGRELEQYPDTVKLEALQQIAPYSRQFGATAKKVVKAALANQLTPMEEQRAYETIDQVNEIKNQIYASKDLYNTDIQLEELSGIVRSVNYDTGQFLIEGNDKEFSVAGVSFSNADIRASLLQRNHYSSADQLNEDMIQLKERMAYIMESKIKAGAKIEFDVASATNLGGNEALLSNLTKELLDIGAPRAYTGVLGERTVTKERSTVLERGLARLWEGMSEENTYFNKKFNAKRHYLNEYLGDQVFSRQIRLWTRPIEHIAKPFISQLMHQYGVDKIPTFTEKRRYNQQYWDTIKYIKYKMLEKQAIRSGDDGAASKYRNLWRNTMVGANPFDKNPRDEMMAMPKGERAYFDLFASEPDPEVRGKILKYIPQAAKRIYKSVWLKKMAEASNDEDLQIEYNKMRESEGYELSEDEEELYQDQTGGRVSKAEWARAQYVANFMKNNPVPGLDWAGWAPNVDIENVQLLSIKDQGEQIQDYGFFDQKAREAAFDEAAYRSALYINSISKTTKSTYSEIIPMIIGGGNTMRYPTRSQSPISNVRIQTNDYRKRLKRQHEEYTGILGDRFILGA